MYFRFSFEIEMWWVMSAWLSIVHCYMNVKSLIVWKYDVSKFSAFTCYIYINAMCISFGYERDMWGIMSAWLSIVHCHMSVKSSECLMCQSVVWVTFSHPSVSDPPSPWKMLRVDKMKRKKTVIIWSKTLLSVFLLHIGHKKLLHIFLFLIPPAYI